MSIFDDLQNRADGEGDRQERKLEACKKLSRQKIESLSDYLGWDPELVDFDDPRVLSGKKALSEATFELSDHPASVTVPLIVEPRTKGFGVRMHLSSIQGYLVGRDGNVIDGDESDFFAEIKEYIEEQLFVD